MAQITGNTVTPQQKALNNKLSPNPFGFPSPKPVSPFGSGNTLTAPAPQSTSTPSWQQTLSDVQGSFFKNNPTVPRTPGLASGVIAKPQNSVASPQTLAVGGNPAIVGNAVIPQDPNGTYTPQQQVQPPQQNLSQNPTYPGLVSSLVKIGQQGSQGYNTAVQNLSDFRRKVAGESANIAQTPIELGFQQGRQQVLTQKSAVEDAALQNAVNQQQTQQGQQINALGTAMQSVAPQAGVSYFGNPLTGGIVGDQNGGGLGIDYWAQQLATGAVGPQNVPSTITSSPVLYNQLLQKTQQMNPNFNINSSTGNANAQQSAAQIAGTTVPQANQSIYANALGDYYGMNAQLQNVEGLGSLLLDTAQGAQINPFDPQLANQSITWLRGQLSSPAQARFNSTLATFQGAAQSLLANGAGQTPTNVVSAIQGIANGSLSLGALKALVDQAKQEGTIKLQNQGGIVNQARSGTLGGQPTNANAQSTTNPPGWF